MHSWQIGSDVLNYFRIINFIKMDFNYIDILLCVLLVFALGFLFYTIFKREKLLKNISKEEKVQKAKDS